LPEHPNSQSSQALRDTGKACLAAGDRDGAIAAFAQAYRLMPTAMDLYEALLDLYMATGRAKDGSKFFEDMSRLAPKAVAFLFARGRLKAEQGLALEAAKIFEQAATLAPTSSGMKYWRGCALLQAGHYKPAMEAFAQSLSLPSPSPQESNECSDRKKDAEMLGSKTRSRPFKSNLAKRRSRASPRCSFTSTPATGTRFCRSCHPVPRP